MLSARHNAHPLALEDGVVPLVAASTGLIRPLALLSRQSVLVDPVFLLTVWCREGALASQRVRTHVLLAVLAAL